MPNTTAVTHSTEVCHGRTESGRFALKNATISVPWLRPGFSVSTAGVSASFALNPEPGRFVSGGLMDNEQEPVPRCNSPIAGELFARC